eukprot:TRINITY_DN2160_c0_g1_i4.p1 TRINITY_DN2160_c0_g1~~TRINITY_DN2160_c0_g1_i4.p1  ORF type:complete len:736 (+),score=120.14 TRINITY_DN2160_c0_g1_i4:441-2648(+)
MSNGSPVSPTGDGFKKKEALLPRRMRASVVEKDDEMQDAAKRETVVKGFVVTPAVRNDEKDDKPRSRWGPLRPGPALPPLGLGKEIPSREYAPCLGIDLGTTNSCVAAWNGKTATVLRSFQYSTTLIPSVVAYTPSEVLVGHAAVKQWPMNPKDTIVSSKRWIGRPYNEEAQEAADQYTYDVVGDKGTCVFELGCRTEGEGDKITQKTVAPEVLGGIILEHIKDIAVTDHLRADVRDAVITVPAYFNDAQRAATKKAGELAGLRVLMVLNEPTAAALACGLHEVKSDENLWQKKNILVFDLGGGTFDVTVMFMDKKRFEVLATGGDTQLGGDDFDHILLRYFREEMTKKFPDAPKAKDRFIKITEVEEVKLRQRCREIKEALSGTQCQHYEMEIAGRTFTGSLTRAKLSNLCSPLISKAMKIMGQVLKDSGLHKGSIDDVVLVGGSTKMTKVQQEIEKFFEGFKAFIVKTVSPDEIVAEGAVIKAACMLETECRIPPPSLPLISDVVPQTVGVESQKDNYSVVIPRNTPIPSSQKLEKFFVYHTTKDNQRTVEINVYQGEATKASDNFYLGTCKIDNIPPKPMGEVDICVKYAFDQMGILEIVAWIQGMGHITTSTSVTDSTYEANNIRKDNKDVATIQAAEAQPINLSANFFIPPNEVPRDADDRRRDEERHKEYNRQREMKKRDKKEAREKGEKEDQSLKVGKLHSNAGSSMSTRPLSARSLLSGRLSARKSN